MNDAQPSFSDVLRSAAAEVDTPHEIDGQTLVETETGDLLRRAATEIERLQAVVAAAAYFRDEALAVPLDPASGVRHYDLANHGGPVGDLFRALEELEAS